MRPIDALERIYSTNWVQMRLKHKRNLLCVSFLRVT